MIGFSQRRNQGVVNISRIFVVWISVWNVSLSSTFAAVLSGTIFTTNGGGTSAHKQSFETKGDVYLNGGPGPNAPPNALGLPQGTYVFQVTAPSGKELLSSDPIQCRRFHVNSTGMIDTIISSTVLKNENGRPTEINCSHAAGKVVDPNLLDTISIQLVPFTDSPDPNGIYTVWVTPIERFVGTTRTIDTLNHVHGFVPIYSKTATFIVPKKNNHFEPGTLKIRAFHDRNLNQTQDGDEEDIVDWQIDVTDSRGAINTFFTPGEVLTTQGIWKVLQYPTAQMLLTSSFLDGSKASAIPNADPEVVVLDRGASNETHEVVFGNIGLGEIVACKYYDRNGNGFQDDTESRLKGWPVVLSGMDISGTDLDPVQKTTDKTGCATFRNLRPGTYEIEEQHVETADETSQWISTTPTTATVIIQSRFHDGRLWGSTKTVAFGNACLDKTTFATRGFWHNKYGLSELDADDIAYANNLIPFQTLSSYFESGDEPFDGAFDNGDPVNSALDASGFEMAPGGSAKSEISQFLVAPAAGNRSRQNLAQQLLAFVFNVRNRLDTPRATIQIQEEGLMTASQIITQAVDVWENDDESLHDDMAIILNELNSTLQLPFIRFYPCKSAPLDP